MEKIHGEENPVPYIYLIHRLADTILRDPFPSGAHTGNLTIQYHTQGPVSLRRTHGKPYHAIKQNMYLAGELYTLNLESLKISNCHLKVNISI